jgi:hypothetical protein
MARFAVYTFEQWQLASVYRVPGMNSVVHSSDIPLALSCKKIPLFEEIDSKN